MDNFQILKGLVDEVFQQKGVPSSKDNVKYICPFHQSSQEKRKFELKLGTDENGYNPSQCWVCSNRFKTLRSLFRKLNASKKQMDQLDILISNNGTREYKKEYFSGVLPEEYIFLPEAPKSNIMARHIRKYLKERGVTNDDIYRLSIGFCDDGIYDGRIIIPSYDENGKINLFVGRGIDTYSYPKYIYPEISRDIIFNDLFINWNEPLILVEGPMDTIAVKRNVIPLLGKSITKELMKKIITGKNKKIFIALDGDALKKSLEHCQTLLNYGKKVYLIEMPKDKDPGEIGFNEFTNMLSMSKELDLSKIMEIKLKLMYE